MTDAIPIALDEGEYLWGLQGAILRQSFNMGRGRKPANNPHPETLSQAMKRHVIGFLGEMAFAKHMGVWPSSIFTFRGADVAGWEVKATTKLYGRMILQADSVPERRYVLLTGDGRSFLIRGWMWGKEALETVPIRDALNNGRPAIFVEQHQLHPMAEAA